MVFKNCSYSLYRKLQESANFARSLQLLSVIVKLHPTMSHNVTKIKESIQIHTRKDSYYPLLESDHTFNDERFSTRNVIVNSIHNLWRENFCIDPLLYRVIRSSYRAWCFCANLHFWFSVSEISWLFVFWYLYLGNWATTSKLFLATK